MEGLIERAKAGDGGAMEELLQAVAPSLQRFGQRMCRNETDAEDVLQDALISIANHLGEFEGRSSFSSWAFTLARSACHRKRRGLKNQPHMALDDAGEPNAPSLTPEQHASELELSRALNRALERLPEDYREVILLRDVEDMTAPEAAAVLGITVDALKSRLHRARHALRDSLRPVLEPAPQPAADAGCPDILALWSRKLEGDLSALDCAQMEKHMQTCPSCSSACSALKSALLACKRVGSNKVGPELQSVVKSAVRNWIQAGGSCRG